MIAFKNTFGVELPRCTYNQAQVGQFVRKAQLRVGDLVFFQTSKYSRHVGIYLGKGQFAHTSKRLGVTISSIYNGYWQSRYGQYFDAEC